LKASAKKASSNKSSTETGEACSLTQVQTFTGSYMAEGEELQSFTAVDVDECRQHCSSMASCVSAYIDSNDMKCMLSNAEPIPLMYRRYGKLPEQEKPEDKHAFIFVARAASHGVYEDQPYAHCENQETGPNGASKALKTSSKMSSKTSSSSKKAAPYTVGEPALYQTSYKGTKCSKKNIVKGPTEFKIGVCQTGDLSGIGADAKSAMFYYEIGSNGGVMSARKFVSKTDCTGDSMMVAITAGCSTVTGQAVEWSYEQHTYDDDDDDSKSSKQVTKKTATAKTANSKSSLKSSSAKSSSKKASKPSK